MIQFDERAYSSKSVAKNHQRWYKLDLPHPHLVGSWQIKVSVGIPKPKHVKRHPGASSYFTEAVASADA